MSNRAIIVAAGKAARFGDKLPKQFHEIAGMPLLAWTIRAFEKARSIEEIVVVVSNEFQLFVTQKVIEPYKFQKVNKIVSGGKSRKESVHNALAVLPSSTKVVAIHDGVRPLIETGDIDRVVECAIENRAAMLAVPVKETVKEVSGDTIVRTLAREKIWLAQTPQAFEYSLIMQAHSRKSEADDESVTDDSILVEQMGVKVKVIEPTGANSKVTTLEDMSFVEAELKKRLNG